MKSREIRIIAVAIFILFAFLIVLVFTNQYFKEKSFYENPINGVVESTFNSQSGLLFKLQGLDDPINLYLNSSNAQRLSTGDSIAKYPLSSELRVYSNETDFSYFELSFKYFNTSND